MINTEIHTVGYDTIIALDQKDEFVFPVEAKVYVQNVLFARVVLGR